MLNFLFLPVKSRMGGEKNKLIVLIGLLMALLCLQCVVDIPFILDDFLVINENTWNIITAFDIVVEPFFAAVLILLCKPDKSSSIFLTLTIHLTPIVLLAFLYTFTFRRIFYDLLILYSLVYGVFYFLWTFVNIPRYHRWLKENFSFTEGIDLRWLRYILISFFFVLLFWICDAVTFNLYLEIFYMISSLSLWLLISYYLERHITVIYGAEAKQDESENEDSAPFSSNFSKKIETLFVKDRIYLDTGLRLSDVAGMMGTNRTYMSKHFNEIMGKTFFDYVNDFRCKRATELLCLTDEPLYLIAEQSGFNSLSTFRRQFQLRYNCSPADYRKKR